MKPVAAGSADAKLCAASLIELDTAMTAICEPPSAQSSVSTTAHVAAPRGGSWRLALLGALANRNWRLQAVDEIDDSILADLGLGTARPTMAERRRLQAIRSSEYAPVRADRWGR